MSGIPSLAKAEQALAGQIQRFSSLGPALSLPTPASQRSFCTPATNAARARKLQYYTSRALELQFPKRKISSSSSSAAALEAGDNTITEANLKKRDIGDISGQKDVAVLGAGITGLATAWFLTQEMPDAKVTIYEKSDRLGGWMHSKKVDVDGGQILFEQGPRSLRPQAPNGTVALRLAQSLDMESELLITKRNAPSAQNRFIYYPDHLVRMPGPGQSIFDILGNVLSEPVFDGLITAILTEWSKESRHKSTKDESVGGFITRRFNKAIANNMASALFHGIYAGDIWQLSAKSILPVQWAQEYRHDSSSRAAWEAFRHKTQWSFCDDVELQMELQEAGWSQSMRERLADCSVFTFQKGLGSLVERLEHRLRHHPNVTIRKSTSITELVKSPESSSIVLSTLPAAVPTVEANVTTPITKYEHSHVVATIAAPAVEALIPQETISALAASDPSPHGLRNLRLTRAVSVAVVNFYFPTSNLLQKIKPNGGLPRGLQNGLQGFGYLIPQSVPFEQNPERALGVIFDSDISPDLWTSVPREQLGTKLTVMLGGHWWDGWRTLPSEDDCKEMALDVLARHLNITEKPTAVNVTIQKNCIPQYTVGHEERMSDAHRALQSLFEGRLKVAGSWYTGVGVNDCLRSARDVVKSMKRHDASARTGLERFSWGRPMALVKRAGPGLLDIIKVDELAKRLGYFRDVPKKNSSDDD